jgi:hypothetical protein
MGRGLHSDEKDKNGVLYNRNGISSLKYACLK